MGRFIFLLITLVLFNSIFQPCSWAHPRKNTRTLENAVPVDVASLPLAPPLEGDLQLLRHAIELQISTCKTQPANETRQIGNRTFTRKTWCIDTGNKIIELIDKSNDWNTFYALTQKEMQWYQSAGDPETHTVKFTGYYSPTLKGKRTPDALFKYPIYAKPDNLVYVDKHWRRKHTDGTLSPYYSRKEIDEQGVLKNKKLEIAYCNDPFAVSILQVQGSGFIDLIQNDGSIQKIQVNYAAQNGLTYTSVRHTLKDKGVSEEYLTIPGQKHYFQLHPEELLPSLHNDQSYVFFEETHTTGSLTGPLGTDNTPLTPRHSIATDLNYYPAGLIALNLTQRPVAPLVATQNTPNSTSSPWVDHWQPFAQFAVVQDTGGAIKGPGRVDFYWGEDDYAEFAAGMMNQTGELYFLLPRL